MELDLAGTLGELAHDRPIFDSERDSSTVRDGSGKVVKLRYLLLAVDLAGVIVRPDVVPL